MIVVSDTTPLNYLVLINAVDVLPKLFQEVYTPNSVLRELDDAKSPPEVRGWLQAIPAWLKVLDPRNRLPSTVALDIGEAEAISLAKERGIADILIDEYRGRKIAQAEGLFVLPTVAVLERAAERDLIDLPKAFEALRQTTYRVRPEILIAALARDLERRQQRGA